MNINDVYNKTDIENNIYLKRAFEIINYRKEHKLKYISSNDRRSTDYIHCRRHHIILKSLYKYLNLPIDNSENNLINVTISEHIKIHYYNLMYHKSKEHKTNIDHFLIMANSNALHRIFAHDKITLESVKDDNINELSKMIEEGRIESSLQNSVFQKKKWEDEDYKREHLEKMKKGITEESEQKRINSIKKSLNTEEYRKYRSERSKKMWKDEDKRRSIIEKRISNNKANPDKLKQRGENISKALNRNPNIIKNRNAKNSKLKKEWWKNLSDEQRQLMSEKQTVNYKITMMNKECQIIKIFNSFQEIKDYFNLSIKIKSIKEYIRTNKHKILSQYKWIIERSRG